MRGFVVWATFIYTLGLLGLSAAWQLGATPWWVALSGIIAPFFFLPFAVMLPLAFWIRRRFYLVCLGIIVLLFVLTFGERFLPRAPVQASGGERLRVMTLNHRKANEQVNAVRDAILRHEADIVALQELSVPVAEMARAELSTAYPHQLLEPAPEGSGDGLGVLSRYPLEEPRAADGYRGQRLHVRVAGKRVTLINVHLTVPFEEEGGAVRLRNFHADRRNRELEALLAEIRSVPFVVLGDFNLSDNEPGYRKLAQQLTDAYRRTQAGFGFSYPAQRNYRGVPLPPLVRIDYVWLQGLAPLSAARDCRTSSDHCALIADLALP